MANDPEITLDEIAKEIGVGTPSVDREIVQMSELFQRNKSMLLKNIIFPRFVLGLAEESEGQ